MRSPAMVGAIFLIAWLIGGCPARDTNQSDSADNETPASQTGDSAGNQTPTPQDSDAASTAPPVGEPAPGSGDTTADDSGNEVPADDADEQPPAPELPPLTPGMYIGTVTLIETAHCTGMYAALVGADVRYEDEWPDYGLVIRDDGLPNLENQTVDMGGIAVDYTFSSLQVSADSVVVNWVTEVHFVDETTGQAFFSMPGEQTDVYRELGAGLLQIEFTLDAGTTDQLGSVAYEVKMTGELSKL